MNTISTIYPYEKDDSHHEYAWVFFHAPGFAPNIEIADELAKHIFDDLGCAPPGSRHQPRVKYDALGSAGAPWQPGAWIPLDEPRMDVTATIPDKPVAEMSEEEKAEALAALQAEADAQRARTAEAAINERLAEQETEEQARLQRDIEQARQAEEHERSDREPFFGTDFYTGPQGDTDETTMNEEN